MPTKINKISKQIAFQIKINSDIKAKFKALCAENQWHIYERIETLINNDILAHKK